MRRNPRAWLSAAPAKRSAKPNGSRRREDKSRRRPRQQRSVNDILNRSDATLACTHATVWFALKKHPPQALSGTVLAIDDSRRVSADTEEDWRLAR
ncbi:hypothetical protein [Paenarthrobacter aurescens]|uniref:hypothetical protein n=1 Tax=Paenarthrobacter aurescens TaxID=43663 RepID=UPI001142CDF9|nr:hypothetical protein [Paenarthrobacter aurescens]MDO6143383.1 hypothetical protein [Paenarthrobacter aurescens]MDO6147231.1 hypothetical protein [Paenarthrobacter aurescens]MDO6158475.1 hypothetical protein [Paenarthrobacter aurescens]